MNTGNEIRFAKGTRVWFTQERDSARRAAVVLDDCACWHSFATIHLKGSRKPRNVWAGTLEPCAPSQETTP